MISENILEKRNIDNKFPEWLRERKKNALAYFSSVPMPLLKYGLNIVLRPDLDLDDFDFSDGKNNEFMIDASDGIKISSLSEHPEAEKHFMKLNGLENYDKFSSMHVAFLNNGMVIEAPKGIKGKVEIKSLMKSTNLVFHLIVIAEPQSELEIIESISSEIDSGKKGVRSGVVEIFAKEGSRVKYASVQNLEGNIYDFSTKKGVTEKDANIDWLACCIGSAFSKLDVSTVLKGQGSGTNNWGLFFGKGTQQFEISSSTIHSAPNTFSDMITKGALDGSSKAVYQGLIKINENAANSNGYQKEDTLMLSEKAEMNPIPNLEINNNEVKCSHGASVGQLDKEKMFYLKSRGISEESAKSLIVEGFFESLTDKFGDEIIKQQITEIIRRKINVKD